MVSIKAPLFAGPQWVVKKRGVFDFWGLLRGMHGWIVNQGYEVHETAYKHKVPTPAGVEQEIKWKGWKKVTGYVKFWVEVYFHVYDMKEVDVIKDGKKKRMVQARLLVEFSGYVELDYNNYFKGPLLKTLQNFLHRYVWYKKITGGWQDELYYRIFKLHRLCKELLDMETPTDSSRYRY